MVPGSSIRQLQTGGTALLIDGLIVVEQLPCPVLFLVAKGHEDNKESGEKKDAHADPVGNCVAEQGVDLKLNPA